MKEMEEELSGLRNEIKEFREEVIVRLDRLEERMDMCELRFRTVLDVTKRNNTR